MAQIFFNSFGKKGTLTIWSFVILTQYVMGSGMVCLHAFPPGWHPVTAYIPMIVVDARCVSPVLRLVCLGLAF